ncbi:hypothetical protein DFH09DRAFT_1288126 [Mycena vulgaris]|nr:hypothetical protein DFH09DRAFT_1288126 [Mycena vulgaris]
MPITTLESSFETVRSGDALHLDIPPPYCDSPHRNLSLRAEKKRGELRPLPPPPAHPSTPSSVAARLTLRRRASGGCFVDLEARPAKKRAQRFYICNPSDSPISPAQPDIPSPILNSEKLLPIHIIPPTPLPPPTPGLSQSHTANLMPAPYPPSSEAMPPIRTAKMHRRFGGSVGSVPASVLAELRSLGEERGLSRAMTLPSLLYAEQDSDRSSSEEDDGGAEGSEDENPSWVVNATRVVRSNRRVSPSWVRDLGGDRWIADNYSSILRAL